MLKTSSETGGLTAEYRQYGGGGIYMDLWEIYAGYLMVYWWRWIGGWKTVEEKFL